MRQSRKDPQAPLMPKAAWSRPFAAFVGRTYVAETYAIDGRADADFAPVWDHDLAAKPYWTSDDGYEIRAVADPDYRPDTMVLTAPDGERCGFYSGGQLWVDPAHRGQGLGAELVLAMTSAIGRGPTSDSGGMGFTEAGLTSHRRAWCLSVERAVDARLAVDPWNVTSSQVLREADPAPASGMGMR